MSFLTATRRIARHRAATPAELREENKLLLAREIAASDFFTLLIQDRDEVHALWQHAETKAADAELVVVCQQADIEQLTAEVTALNAQLANVTAVTVPEMVRDTSDGADQATAPIDVRPLWEAHGISPVIRIADAPSANDPRTPTWVPDSDSETTQSLRVA